MVKYYDVHVFLSRNDGYSVPVKVATNQDLTDDQVIEIAVDSDLLDMGDSNHVDYVIEISEFEYNEMKGI